MVATELGRVVMVLAAGTGGGVTMGMCAMGRGEEVRAGDGKVEGI